MKNAKKLKAADLKNIKGGASGTPDLSKCYCVCGGVVGGPEYCADYVSCPLDF
ncbi:hypothetical protein J2Y40_001220 [Chryseobacterium sp. 2987]|nr:hypothetical protein [Chryseobacterium sp. 2987]